MTRKDFLERLKRLMKDMDEKERQDVLDYYRDYMDDAGIQENDSVDGMFDSPEKIVSTLRSSLKEEAIKSEKAAQSEKELVKKDTSVNNDSAKKKKRSIGKLALIILLILIAVPVALGTCGLHAYRNMRMSGVVRFDDWNDQYDVDILDDFAIGGIPDGILVAADVLQERFHLIPVLAAVKFVGMTPDIEQHGTKGKAVEELI